MVVHTRKAFTISRNKKISDVRFGEGKGGEYCELHTEKFTGRNRNALENFE
jgi:hypothetical protein